MSDYSKMLDYIEERKKAERLKADRAQEELRDRVTEIRRTLASFEHEDPDAYMAATKEFRSKLISLLGKQKELREQSELILFNLDQKASNLHKLSQLGV